jgi:hypothetical protein
VKQQSGMAMVALAVLGAVLILVFGYLFGVSPQLSAAATANGEHDLAVQDNQSIRDQIEKLKGLGLEVPAWQADIDALAEQVPPLPDTEHLHRMLIDAATDAGIPWVEFRIDTISVIDTATAAPPADAAPTTGEDATTEDAGNPSPAPTETAAPATPEMPDAPEGLIAIQFTAKTEGHPAALMQFLTNLYQQDRRFVTLSGLTMEGSDGADAAPGRPALEKGDGKLTVSGIAFVLIDPAHPLEIDETGGVPVPLPSPSPSVSS